MLMNNTKNIPNRQQETVLKNLGKVLSEAIYVKFGVHLTFCDETVYNRYKALNE